MKQTSLLLTFFFLATILFLGSCGKKEEEKTPETTTSESKGEKEETSSSSKKVPETKINKETPEAWAKSNADRFMALITANEIAQAIDGCHTKAFVNADRKGWLAFFNGLFDEFGIIESYELYDEGADFGEGEAGEGYYYEILYEVRHVELTLYSKIVLFHEKEGEEPQVLGYFYDQTKANNQKTTK